MASSKNYKSIILYCLLVICGFISAFFIFYTVRLLYITNGLSNIRIGGKGTYIGEVTFPILALAFYLISRRLYKTIQKNRLIKKGKSRMNTKNVGTRLSLIIGTGFITGMAISFVDNYAFEGEVSPIIIVALLLLTCAIFGASFGRQGIYASVLTWVCIPLVHLVKHALTLPDTINPNTYASIIKLAIFTFVVASIGFGFGILLNRFFKDAVKNN